MQLKWGITALAVIGLATATNAARASVEVVNEFLAPVAVPTPNAWYAEDVRPGGTASVVSLAGQGGNLENNQPLPIGAAKLTTDDTHIGPTYTAKAEVFTYGNFGSAADVLTNPNLNLGYSYYKTANSEVAAPALKLLISEPSNLGGGVPTRTYGILVFEPYLNSSLATNAWTDISLTGTGSTGGSWWWTGGFGQPNGAGGATMDTLQGWAIRLSGDSAFENATVSGIGMGIGSNNKNETDYFDAVTFNDGITNGVNVTYNFEPVPEAASLCVWSLLALAVGGMMWCRSWKSSTQPVAA